jgi:hypothetical protein
LPSISERFGRLGGEKRGRGRERREERRRRILSNIERERIRKNEIFSTQII